MIAGLALTEARDGSGPAEGVYNDSNACVRAPVQWFLDRLQHSEAPEYPSGPHPIECGRRGDSGPLSEGRLYRTPIPETQRDWALGGPLGVRARYR